jgi:hypothetical protein
MQPHLSLFALLLPPAAARPTRPGHAGLTATEVFRFPNQTMLENVDLLPSGHLIITTLSSADVFTVDPEAKVPTAEKLAGLLGGGVLAGIAPLGHGLYAISGGTLEPVPGNFSIYIVDVAAAAEVDTVPLPDGGVANGLVALPKRPHVILGADSFAGSILRINTRTKEVTTVLSDDALGHGNFTDLPIGVNGLLIRDGYLFFTNSRLGTFSKVRIDDEGYPVGSPQIIAVLPDHSATHAFDDFDMDQEGNAYLAAQPSSLVKITPSGQLTTVLGEGGAVTLDRPTAVALGRGAKSAYVVTFGGQVVRIGIN